MNKNPSLASVFIDHNASIDEHNDDGNTPLHDAVIKGDLFTVKIFLKSGANVNL